MAASKIDTIYVKFMGDARSYLAASAAVSRSMDAISAKARAMGIALTKFVALPLAAIGGMSVVAFAKMDKAMTKSLSIMGDVSDTMRNDLQQEAIRLAMVTNISQDKIAEGYFFLASAGLNAAQALKAVPTVTQFAVAGSFDLARATDLLTDAQSALGLTVKDNSQNMLNMTRVADVLTKANTQANATVEQFSIALTSKAATSMRVFNLEIEEGVAVLSAYADQGIKAELAGTSYDRVLRLLSKSALDNREAHDAFGLSVFDASGKMRGMVPILKDLERGMKDMSEEEKVATLASLGFEARIQQAIFPLIGMSDKIAEYKKNLEAAGGAMDEVANKIMKGFTSQMAVTFNHMKAVAREIGERLAPGILRLGKAIRILSNAWLGLSDSTKTAIVWLGKTAVLMATLSLTVPFVAGAIGFLGARMAILARPLAMIALVGGKFLATLKTIAKVAIWIINPFSKIRLAVMAIVAAMGALFVYFKGEGDMGKAWKLIADSIETAKHAVLGFFENWDTNWPRLKGIFQDFYNNLGTNFLAVLDNMKTNVKAFVMFTAEAFGILVGWFVANGESIAIAFASALIDGFVKAFNYVQSLMAKFSAAMVNIFVVMGVAIVRVFGTAMQGVMRAVQKTVLYTVKIMAALKNMDVGKALSLAIGGAQSVAMDLSLAAVQAAGQAGAAAKAAVQPLVNAFQNGLVEGMTTDDLMGSLGDAFNNSGFVNPLAGTTLDDFGGFDTTRGGVLPQSIDPYAQDILDQERMGEWGIDLDLDTDDAKDKGKDAAADIASNFKMSLGIDTGSVMDQQSKAIVAMSNARNERNAKFIAAEKAEAARKKAERQAAAKEREEAKAAKEKAWKEQLKQLTDIATILKKIEKGGGLGTANFR